MVNKYSVILITLIAILFSSCVSKKKFLEMQSGRLKAEEQVRQLTEQNNNKAERIKSMIADYEQMKNALLENNAIKDNYIDSLNSVVFTLNQKLTEQKESLQQTSFNLDFEKQRLSQTLDAKERNIRQLESKVEELESDISNNTSLLDQKNYDINMLQDKVNTLTTQKERSEDRVKELNSQLEKAKTETDKLKEQLKEKDATITRLENNVKLLKKELGQN